MRIGTGFDVHAFEAGRPLVLCGVRVPHERGLAGPSDADVGLQRSLGHVVFVEEGEGRRHGGQQLRTERAATRRNRAGSLRSAGSAQTSSMRAIGALSPWRGPSLRIRV